MRVITGTCRGRRLKTPAGDDVRPTTDNVKEAVFNIIASDVEGRRVLDLFAGTPEKCQGEPAAMLYGSDSGAFRCSGLSETVCSL